MRPFLPRDGKGKGQPPVITTTGEYALRAAVYLAQDDPQPRTSAEIATATAVPPGYLSKIMQSLVKAGLIKSQRGLGGGFHLSREPEAISVLDVIAAVGCAPQRIFHCPLGLSTHTTLCPLHRLVDNSVKLMEESFKSTSLLSLSSSAVGEPRPLCEVKKAQSDESNRRK